MICGTFEAHLISYYDYAIWRENKLVTETGTLRHIIIVEFVCSELWHCFCIGHFFIGEIVEQYLFWRMGIIIVITITICWPWLHRGMCAHCALSSSSSLSLSSSSSPSTLWSKQGRLLGWVSSDKWTWWLVLVVTKKMTKHGSYKVHRKPLDCQCIKGRGPKRENWVYARTDFFARGRPQRSWQFNVSDIAADDNLTLTDACNLPAAGIINCQPRCTSQPTG